MEVDYELCEACQKSMEESGVIGLTAEEMFEQQAPFKFDLAFILMEEGYDVVRESQKDVLYSTRRLVYVDANGDHEKEYHFASIHEDKVVSYVSFSTEEILADDWVIAKLAE